ncbi:MAG: thioredoxin domain-containing protein [Candidatus Yanofskybacteria bacterium]|nr:thioredoxin domain-containing protein [Candidatus Yanofskybacteria bacterium]
MFEEDLTKKEKYQLKKDEKNREFEQVKKQKTVKRFLLWGLVIVVIGGSIWGLSRIAGHSPQTQTAVLLDAISTNDWVTGNQEAQTTLIEYSDFQCPACGAYYPLVHKLIQEQGKNFKFVYRHFPLKQHSNAEPAAYAVEAAGKQGKFWEMEAMIFEHQNDWSASNSADEIFRGYASALGLNLELFDADRESGEVKDKVKSDYQSGVRAGVNATPTFFLNGKKIQPRNYEEFADFIKQVQTDGSNS